MLKRSSAVILSLGMSYCFSFIEKNKLGKSFTKTSVIYNLTP